MSASKKVTFPQDCKCEKLDRDPPLKEIPDFYKLMLFYVIMLPVSYLVLSFFVDL